MIQRVTRGEHHAIRSGSLNMNEGMRYEQKFRQRLPKISVEICANYTQTVALRSQHFTGL